MSEYQNISKPELKEGAILAIESAEMHLKISETLIESEFYPTSLSHTVLALEEASKALVLRLYAAEKKLFRKIDPFFKSHDPKIEKFWQWFIRDFKNWIVRIPRSSWSVLLGPYILDTLSADNSRSKHQIILDILTDFKSNGFYLSRDFQNDRWQAPTKLDVENNARTWLETAKLYIEKIKHACRQEDGSDQIQEWIQALRDWEKEYY